MVLACYTVEFFDRHTLHRYHVSFCKFQEALGHIAVQIFLDKELIDSTT